jgi:phage shock protein B
MEVILAPALGVLLLVFVLIVTPIWLILHYATRNSASKRLTTKDEALLEELNDNAKRLEERLHNLERILDADSPEWRARS